MAFGLPPAEPYEGDKSTPPEPSTLKERNQLKQKAQRKAQKKRRRQALRDKMKRGLTAQNKRFALEYLKDFNGPRAHEAAGYKSNGPDSRKASASRLLSKPEVQAFILKTEKEALKKAGVTVERIVAEYEKLAFSNIRHYMKIGANGKPYFDLSECTEDQWAALAEISLDEFTEGAKGAKGNGKGEVGIDIKRLRVKTHDKKGSLDSLAKYKQMFVEKHEHTGPDGGPIPLSSTIKFVDP